VLTDANGIYTFSDLTAATYGVTPVLAGYTFSPPSRSVRVGPDTLNADFTGSGIYSIRGTIRGTNGTTGLAGVTVNAGSRAADSGANGAYVISNLPPATYTVTATLAGHTFVPPSRVVTASNHVTGVDFRSGLLFTVSGRITENGNGLAGITVNAGSRSGVTDTNGNYTITNVVEGTNAVAPSSADYVFSPGQQVLVLSSNVNGIDFGASRVFSIAGRVTDGPDGLGGVSVMIANSGATNVVVTDTNGNFRVDNLFAGNYGISPSLEGFSFKPAMTTLTLGPSQTNLHFFHVYQIIGVVTDVGIGLGGVTVTAGTNSAVTAAGTGVYTIMEVPGGTYQVQPSRGSDTFDPPFRQVTVSRATAEQSPSGFYVELDPFSRVHYLGGRVTDSGNAVAGVRITVTNATVTASATTDANGFYLFTTLSADNYTVVPGTNGVGFSPASRIIALSGAATNLDFVRVHLLGGRVTEGTNGLAGLIITATNATVSESATTDTNGFYLFATLQSGTYIVAPPPEGIGFDPTNRSITLPPAVTNADFMANPPMLLSIVHQTNDLTQVSALGLPSRNYLIQFSPDLTNWMTLTNTLAGTNGVFGTDHNPGTNMSSGFYRVRTP
jgi:hypothetical protein